LHHTNFKSQIVILFYPCNKEFSFVVALSSLGVASFLLKSFIDGTLYVIYIYLQRYNSLFWTVLSFKVWW